MKKTGRARKRQVGEATDLRPEYGFDDRQAKPNRFAAKYPAGSRVVVLDADGLRLCDPLMV
jgi:hypothetical protein